MKFVYLFAIAILRVSFADPQVVHYPEDRYTCIKNSEKLPVIQEDLRTCHTGKPSELGYNMNTHPFSNGHLYCGGEYWFKHSEAWQSANDGAYFCAACISAGINGTFSELFCEQRKGLAVCRMGYLSDPANFQRYFEMAAAAERADYYPWHGGTK